MTFFVRIDNDYLLEFPGKNDNIKMLIMSQVLYGEKIDDRRYSKKSIWHAE